MAEKNIVENRPAEDIKERFSSNETVNTVMNGLGKVVDYPMGVVGNLTVKNNAVDASVKPGKALGQSMLMGIVAFGLSLLLGNGLLGSLGFGLGAGIMGQEIRTMGGNLVDTIKGRESFLSGRFLSTAIPLLVSMVLSSKLGPGKALLTTVLGGALGSKVSNYFMGSNEGERYYGEDYVGVRKVAFVLRRGADSDLRVNSAPYKALAQALDVSAVAVKVKQIGIKMQNVDFVVTHFCLPPVPFLFQALRFLSRKAQCNLQEYSIPRHRF